MTFIPLPHGIKVTQRGTLDGLPWSMGIHCVVPGVPSVADLTNLMVAMSTWSGAHLAPVMGTDSVCTETEAKDVSVSPGASAITGDTPPGTGPSVSAPSCMAARGILTTASGTLRKPGAIFFPAVPSVWIVSDILTGPAQAALGTALDDLISALTNAGGSLSVPVVASYRLGAAPRPVAVAFAITGDVIRPKIATQVRRLRGGR